VEQVAQKGYGVSIFSDRQNPTGCCPGQPDVVDPALGKGAGLGRSPRCLPAAAIT